MNDERSKLRLDIAHVLFIDVVGYSKLLINQQTDLLRKLNSIVSNTSQYQEAEATGQLLRLPAGDGMALVFQTSIDAPVQCAAEISEALKQNRAIIPLRMGIHSGPVSHVSDVNRQPSIAGAGINLAQRVMDCGDAGHILLSKHVAEDLEHHEEWRPCLHPLGEIAVKHGVKLSVVNFYTDRVGNPAVPSRLKHASVERTKRKVLVLFASFVVGLVLLSVVMMAIVRYRENKKAVVLNSAGHVQKTIDRKSIAVLPFQSLSEDTANAYFAEGIQDEILTRLSKIADLKVISRTSTQSYRSTPGNLSEIANELGVAHILEGTVQKVGESVRISVQLIDATSGFHVWDDTLDRQLVNLFSVETDVARAIADKLQAKLTGKEEKVIASAPTENAEAYDAYLRGLAFQSKPLNIGANAQHAQQHFRKAIQLDPNFAVAWASLSLLDSRGYRTLSLEPTVALRDEAQQAADKAIALQPDLGEAILAKGYFYYACLRDYPNAVRFFEGARQALPNSSQIPEFLAYVARRQGQWDLSEAYFSQAERLDPRNVFLLGQRAQSYSMLRRFSDARRKFDEVLNIVPDDVDTIAQQAAVAQATGDIRRAATLLSSLKFTADTPTTLETQIYQAILERQPFNIIPELREILISASSKLGYRSGQLRYWLGWAQDVAGDKDSARDTWTQARSELESFLKKQPENYSVIGHLALTDACLGDKIAALDLVDRAIAQNPIEKDALVGPYAFEVMARVAARTNEPDRAINALKKAISTPYATGHSVPLTPDLLRLDPMFDSLRTDQRFQTLVASSAK